MKIKLLELHLRNFKGIKDFTFETEGKNVTVYGGNGTGKTTLFDAFTWLLFDKDSKDSSNFNVKVLDENNNVVHGLENEVSAKLDIDGKVISLKKVYKEKWTKKRGETERTLTGHTTDYYINDVPKKMSEYNNYLSHIIDEETFKILTNPLYFNTSLDWKTRRNIAMNLFEDVENNQVFSKDDSLIELKPLLADKTVEELKEEYRARRRKLNKELKSIPYRIDELSRENEDIDVIELSAEKEVLEGKLAELKNEEGIDYNFRLRQLEGSITVVENELKAMEQQASQELREQLDKAMEEGSELKKNYLQAKEEVELNNGKIETLKVRVPELEKQIVALRKKFKEIANEQFDEENPVCPTCERGLPEESIRKVREEFEDYKKHTLQEINEKGKRLGVEFEKGFEELEGLQTAKEPKVAALFDIKNKMLEKADEVKAIEEQIKSIDVANSPEYIEKTKKLDELIERKNKVIKMAKEQDVSEEVLKLENHIAEIDKQLAKVELQKDNKKRIAGLMDKERDLAQKVAQTEKIEMLCDRYTVVKAELLEDLLNSKFKQVKFKLFDVQVNGGINETFVTTHNGVPFDDLNTAGQINAGLDIINTLSKHYKLSAPIFLDNRESVNDIVEVDTQIINLKVSNHKSLRVEGGE